MIVRNNVDMNNCNCMDYMKSMDDKSVDCVVTDIPYGEVSNHSREDLRMKLTHLRNLNKGAADELTFELFDFAENLIRVCKGSIYVFCGTMQISELVRIFKAHKMQVRVCVWHKTNPSPMNGDYIWLSAAEFCVYAKHGGAVYNNHCAHSVWEYPLAVEMELRTGIHPTMKPLSLIEYLVKSSSNRGDIIFDPCFGSGTTAIACMLQGRRFVGCELDKSYYDAAVQRVKDTMIPNKLFGQ